MLYTHDLELCLNAIWSSSLLVKQGYQYQLNYEKKKNLNFKIWIRRVVIKTYLT